MHYLVYVSQAAQPFTEAALADLLGYSRRRNTAEGITGLLIYRHDAGDGRGCFIQMVEGERDRIDAVWKRIAADKRHHTKIVLEEGQSSTRLFPDWSMGFRNVEAGEIERFEGYSDIGSPAFWQRAAAGKLAGALDLLRAFQDEA